MIPTVQFCSSNPRNSAINIRGLGSPFGLTNDGLEPGVGLYIDGVFFARPASATLDFLDVDQVEVLRGPQGTLFGKNTTAGAINVTTRRPSFTPSTELDVNYGNLQFVQAKASVSGPLGGTSAGRVSFSGTHRDGSIYSVRSQEYTNALNNVGIRGQLLYAPSDDFVVRLATDNTRQRADCCTLVPAGVAPTERPLNRQWTAISKDLNYTPPSLNALDRRTDIDSHLRSNQDLGGAALNIDWKLGPGRLTSTTAWRYWDWDPARDRDFIGLPVTTISAGTSRQHQWTEEVRAHCLRPAHPVGSGDQAGTGRRRLPFLGRTKRLGFDARPARRLRLQPIHGLHEPECRPLRTGPMVDWRPPSPAAWSAAQLRQEERELRSAGLRRPADERPGAHRAQAVGARPAGVHDQRR